MHHSKNSIEESLHIQGTGGRTIGYMPGLDGLRTLAVFAVIAYHLNLPWAPGGLLGVNLFFVLSGYLITNILFVQRDNYGKINLKDFWIRRAKRLLPALFLMLSVLLLWALFFAPERLNSIKHESLAAAFYVGNWYLIFHEVSYFESFGPPSPLGHLWSLAIEEQFYLFWPVILGVGFRYLKKRKYILSAIIAVALVSALAMAIIYVPGADPSRVYYGTDTRAFALLLGSAGAMIWPSAKMSKNIGKKRKIYLEMTGIISLSVVLWMIFKTNQYQTFLYQSGLLIFSVFATFLIVVLAHPSSFLSRLFSFKPLRLLGKWSYGIYLWHYPVIILSSPSVNTGEINPIRCLWQTVVSIILAALSFYIIEEPIRFKKMKPLVLVSRISLSLTMIFAIMMVTSIEGMQILAQDVVNENGIIVEQEKDGQGTANGEIDSEVNKPVDEENKDSNGDNQKSDSEIIDDGGDKNTEDEITSDTYDDMSGEGITIITDSLLIDAKPMLEKKLPGIVVDTKKGRQMYDAPETIDELRKNKRLGGTVIIGLGSNGAFTEKQLKTTLDCLNSAERIILINTRVPKPWENVVNETLSKVAKSYPEITLIDWFEISKGHDEYFYKDGVHLTQKGMQAYYDMLRSAL